eukprot:tig00021518_g22040.t1
MPASAAGAMDNSCFIAGEPVSEVPVYDGVAIAVAAWRERDRERRAEALCEDVLRCGRVTHHAPLGVVPAFAYAYLLMQWIGPPPPPDGARASSQKLFSERDIAEQLQELADQTRKVEKKVFASAWFRRRAGFAPKEEHLVSKCLRKLAEVDWRRGSPEAALARASRMIIAFWQPHAKREGGDRELAVEVEAEAELDEERAFLALEERVARELLALPPGRRPSHYRPARSLAPAEIKAELERRLEAELQLELAALDEDGARGLYGRFFAADRNVALAARLPAGIN